MEKTPTQLDELNQYLVMLAEMDRICIRRKILLIEKYIQNIKEGIQKNNK
tara:strand:- start:4852 stop:5001 length:150 start_codon:yes stop_codon:yes gene_type:complete